MLFAMIRSYAKYLAALLLFGSNGTVASLISLGSGRIVLLRTLVGSLVLLCVFVLARRRRAVARTSGRDWLLLAGSGAALGANWMLLYEAYDLIGVSLATLACYCGPVIVMAVSPLVFGERLGRAKVAGIAVVMAGMLLVNGPSLQQGGLSAGLACGLGSAAMFAVMVVLGKKAQGAPGVERPLVQLVSSFVFVALFLAAKEGFDVAAVAVGAVPAPGDVAPVLLLGAVNTGLGCYLYFSSIPRLPAASVAICGYLEPLAALGFAALFLGEQLGAAQLLGAALVMGGAAFGELSGHVRVRARAQGRNASA